MSSSVRRRRFQGRFERWDNFPGQLPDQHSAIAATSAKLLDHTQQSVPFHQHGLVRMDITHSSEYPEEIESHNSLAILSEPVDDSLKEGRRFGYGGRDCRRNAGNLQEGIEEVFERVGFA